jgi:DNA-binding beta-propeller fold protein YncE
MGPALAVPQLSKWAVSADRDYLIGVTAGSGRLVLARELSRGGRVSALGRWGLHDAVIAVSPSGRTAATYDSGLGRVLVFTGLPERPVLAWSRDLPLAAGEMTSLAVRDDGEQVAAAHGGALLTYDRDGERRLASLAGRAAVTYRPDSDEVLYSDAGGNTLSWIRSGGVLTLAGEADGITSPAAIATALDGRRVFVANQDPPAVIAVDIERGQVERHEVPKAPTTLRRLAGPASFQLHEADDGTVYVLTAEGARARVAFVPPPDDAAAEGGAQ